MNSFLDLLPLIVPELILIVAACALFLLGIPLKPAARRAAPVVALLALLAAFAVQIMGPQLGDTVTEPSNTFRLSQFAQYIKMLACGIGLLFVLMSWPSNEQATGNGALNFGGDAGEFFALILLSLAGILLVAGANDLVLLFLGIELASIPTYIMVSVSRPVPAAQEAGVKYFFLGAMSAAVMLFGFSYLYGTTGTTDLYRMAELFADSLPAGSTARVALTPWQTLAVVLAIAGIAFKIAAVPLHFYVGDVYQGAATPLTALLSFVPKTSGMVALMKILFIVGAGAWAMPVTIAKLLWVLAVLTMTFGNVLGLMQVNVKRALAYSSVAHTGYMLVGLTALAFAIGFPRVQLRAIEGVLFYLAAYGITNAAAFGVLMMLPGRDTETAETYEDLAGTGRRHPGLGLAMAVSCFSLIGLPLTVGFFGKIFLVLPALDGDNSWLTWLVVLTMLNAAISAGYYLRIVGAMFWRPEPAGGFGPEPQVPERLPASVMRPMPVMLAVVLSALATVLFGTVPPATQILNNAVIEASQFDRRPLPERPDVEEASAYRGSLVP